MAPASELLGYRPVRGKPNLYAVRKDTSSIVLGRPDDVGCMWWWHDVDGWFGTQALDVAVTEIGRTSRARAAPRFPRKPRQMTITGTCAAPNPDMALAARDRLFAEWGDPDEEWNLIVEEPTPKALRVRLGGEITAPWAKPVKTFAFQVPLVAADGAKHSLSSTSVTEAPLVPGGYGAAWDWEWTGPGDLGITWESDEMANAGVLECFNAGSLEAPITVTFKGPLTKGWRLDNLTTGRRMSFDTTLRQGQTMTVDTGEGLAYVNNHPVAARLRGDWLYLRPGMNRLLFTDPLYEGSGETQARITWFSAWR